MSRKKCTSIGGQAVIEGVMMRGVRSMATAVRDENQNIVVESKYVTPVAKKNIVFRIPFLRGIFNFVSTMIVGMGTLLRSGEVFEGETEPSKTEKWVSKKLHVSAYNLMMAFAVIIGIAFSIGLFFFLPQALTSLIIKLGHIDVASLGVKIGMNFLEGVIRIIIFVAYIALTSLMSEIKRTYMYHGAEHKTISCYEHDLELTVANARTMTTVHDRCGTTFMFIIMFVSVLVFSFLGWSGNLWIRFALRLLMLPIVAGVSYEVLKLLAKFDNWFVRILKAPGLWLQKLTTKEPTDDMLEVAIMAFKTVMEMDADPNLEEKQFDTLKSYHKVRDEIDAILLQVNADKSDGDWIMCEAMNIQRSELATVSHIKISQYNLAKKFANERAQGKPLWKVFGKVDFYGIEIKINEDVLCPRPETEYLAECVIKECKSIAERGETNIEVLDLCSGSGCIAIAVATNTSAHVDACDISDKAIAVATDNVISRGLSDKINVKNSDMYCVIDKKYDIIVSNPPYIKSSDIDSLAGEVKNFDPRIALDGGADGLDFYRIITAGAKDFLKVGGLLAVECGQGQAEAVVAMLPDYECKIVKDLEGIDRIVTARLTIGENENV